jgi:hypothetical protein
MGQHQRQIAMVTLDENPVEPARDERKLDRIIQAFVIAPMTAGIACGLGFSLLGLALAASGHLASLSRWEIGAAMFAVLVGVWAYPIALVVGVPLYVLLRHWIPLTPLRCTMVGAVVGGAVAMTYLELNLPRGLPTLLLHGLIGWPHYLALGLASGALPGFCFYVIATRRAKALLK